MLGYIPENNHPYSWSAIINGFDPVAMANCPAPVIFRYLSEQPPGSVGIPFAKVTHIWTDVPEDAEGIAKAALIPTMVKRPEDVLGEVEAVIIATDDGDDHIRRVEPFLSAGLPIFVDKPLATNLADLKQFIKWKRQGVSITSSSGLRYAPELEKLRRAQTSWRWITGSTCKSWKRYGIHVLEPVSTLTGPGFASVRARQSGPTFLAEIEHRNGTMISLAAIEEGFGSAFVLHGYADTGHVTVEIRNNYAAFRAQLVAFLEYATGQGPEPVDFSQTIELMSVLIAAEQSARGGGERVDPTALLGGL